MEFIFVLSVVFLKVIFIYLFKIVEVVWTFRINAFMDNEVLTVFFRNKYPGAVRTMEFVSFRETIILGRCIQIETDFASNLAFLLTIIPREILDRSFAYRAAVIIRNVAFNPAEYRSDIFVIASLIISDKVVPLPVLFIGNDAGKFIDFEFLVFGRMGIIESPLLKRDIFADKVD